MLGRASREDARPFFIWTSGESRVSCLILIGMMGAGKTTVGKELARRRKVRFADCDHEIIARTGVSIPTIFEIEGEEGFRRRETHMVDELTQEPDIVIATGGGVVTNPANRELMRARGVVIYLNVPPQILYERTRHDRNRPLLQVENPRQRIEELYQQRDPLYREVAHLIVEGGRGNPGTMVRMIENALHKLCPAEPENYAMRTLNVALGERAYPIHIGRGLLDHAELILPQIRTRRVAIVTNDVVGPLYLARLRTALESAGVQVAAVSLPDGEAHKDWQTLNRIFDMLLVERCERSTTLIALGGGVVGDMGGFAAACYQRGMPFIQIPTTLLAQVDSSVGGKTAINHPLGKNMIGAFYQPRLVLADIDTLNTLPARELSAGLAEVIKYGLIRDIEFLEWLEQNLERLVARDPAALAHAIERSCRNKAEVVAADETEQGERALLNLGHTFGHAIETGLGYGVWLHGEAVAAGTMMAAELSRQLGWLSAADLERIAALFERAGLPVWGPRLGVERYLELMAHDKKVEAGKLRLILLRALGQGVIHGDASQADIAAAIEARCR